MANDCVSAIFENIKTVLLKGSFETSVNIYQRLWRNISEDLNLRTYTNSKPKLDF
jgi:hypothetical protein